MMRKYEKYKDSRVEWIGEVPEHWEITRLKNITKLYGRIGFRGYTQNDLVPKSEGAITLSPSNMKNGTMDYSKCSYLTWAKYYESPEIIIRNEDVLFVKTGSTYGKVSYVSGLPMQSTINPQIVVFKEVRCNRKFLFYLLINNVIQDQVAFTVGGSTIPTLSQENILNYSFALPKIIEQQSIASYLDSKVGEIDNMIEKTEKKIKLYEELKKSIITHAVTKGLNPNAKMKDSGVEWIGEIPTDWEVRKLKHIAFLQSGNTIKPESISEDGKYPVYGGNGFRGYTDNYTNDGYYVLIGRQGALCGNVNYATEKFYASEHAVVVYPLHNENVRWLGECIRCSNLNQYSQSAAQPGLAVSVIKNIYFPYPNNEIQNEIGLYLNEKFKAIDSQISIAHKRIDLLKELKSSLITNVVTGKIKVC